MAEKNPNSERQQKKELLVKLYNGEITLQEIKEEHTEMYVNSLDTFEMVQKMYYKDHNISPKGRLNIVMAGKGGCGKTTCCYLIPKLLDYKKKDIFTFTDIEASFLTYTNEKVVVGNEGRTGKLGTGGIERFLSATDTGEYNEALINVKYGAVKVVQELNCINTSQNYMAFLSGLCDKHQTGGNTEEGKTYSQPENPEQINRRFPIVLSFDKTFKGENEYTTEITGYGYDESKVVNVDTGDHYVVKFIAKLETTKENYKMELEKFCKGLVSNIDMDTYTGHWNNLDQILNKETKEIELEKLPE